MATDAGPRDRPPGDGEERLDALLPVPTVGIEDEPGADEPGADEPGADEPGADGPGVPGADRAPDDDPDTGGQSFRELRPPRRLRIWQIAPVVALGVLGSLMFAFPLAFEISEGGAVVAMLGLLLSGASVGWGAMAARRVGHAWPGLPERGSGRRADWRVVAVYAAVTAAAVFLALWRVARLR